MEIHFESPYRSSCRVRTLALEHLEIFLAKFVLWWSLWITKNPIYRDEKMCFRSFGITQDCTRLWRILLYILLTLNSMLQTCHLTDSQYVVWFLRFFTFNQNVDIINILTTGRADSPQSVTVRRQNDELPVACIFENVFYMFVEFHGSYGYCIEQFVTAK